MPKLLSGHWRGEYPLGRAFWLHGIVTWIVINAFSVGLAVANPDDGSRTAKGISVLSLCVIAALVWLFVGIWRSASLERKAGRLFWPFMAQCWVVLFVVSDFALAVIIFASRSDFG